MAMDFSDNFPWWKYINRPEPSVRDYEALKDRMDMAVWSLLMKLQQVIEL
jgi:hypothetical protein